MSHLRDTFERRLTRFSLRNAVPMNLLFIVLVILGALVVSKMPVDVYPDISLDEAVVHTFWFGASAEDVERLVTDRIEDKILDIRGVERITSDSKPDLSRIRVKFRDSLSDTDFDAALRQLRASVEQFKRAIHHDHVAVDFALDSRVALNHHERPVNGFTGRHDAVPIDMNGELASQSRKRLAQQAELTGRVEKQRQQRARAARDRHRHAR